MPHKSIDNRYAVTEHQFDRVPAMTAEPNLTSSLILIVLPAAP
ncbi:MULTISPECIES: hypothetical protein [unclassified Microcoleus]